MFTGSYGDNLKVKTPNEFDMVFNIKFPEYKLLEVTKDDAFPGNVCINFTKVIKKIAKEDQHKIFLCTITNQKWLNEKNYLLVEKLQSYIASCFTKTLNAHFAYEFEINGTLSRLKYKRCGPAHTVLISSNNAKIIYSIDFVPGILLTSEQNPWNHKSCQWSAIPKPNKNPLSFRSSFYSQERDLINKKYNLKNALRLLKKFRDSRQNMMKMKSYYIKTLFLWKNHQENDKSYWTSSLTKIVIDVGNFQAGLKFTNCFKIFL